MDPEVSRAKFDTEIAAINDEASSFAKARGWEVVRTEYPVLAVVLTHPRTQRRVGFRFVCDGWNEQPPSLALFDPKTDADLPWAQWPQGGWSAGDAHPVTQKPFLCLPGIREYHVHPSHLDNPWTNYKSHDSYKLRYIVHRVQQRFGDTNG